MSFKMSLQFIQELIFQRILCQELGQEPRLEMHFLADTNLKNVDM